MQNFDPKDGRNFSGSSNTLAAHGREAPVSTASATPSRIALAEALRKGWFEIWYQPKIDLKRKSLTGAQALARLRHPELGVLPPADFLYDGEDGIAELAQHTLLGAMFDWSKFEEAGFCLRLSINVPVGGLLKLPIPRLVAQYRPHSQRWPGLILEISEDQIARGSAPVEAIAAQLRVNGIAIAIDDFGAGLTSFASLCRLPFAELKIDRSFVVGCASDATNAAICQTAIDLAHRFGGVAVADGIENAADMQALIGMGCDFGEGTLIAPPMPKQRFLELLRQRKGRPAESAPRPAVAPPRAGAA